MCKILYQLLILTSTIIPLCRSETLSLVSYLSCGRTGMKQGYVTPQPLNYKPYFDATKFLGHGDSQTCAANWVQLVIFANADALNRIFNAF